MPSPDAEGLPGDTPVKTQGRGTRRSFIIRVAVFLGLVILVTNLWPEYIAPLPFPCPQHGRVVDAETGEPVAGATLSYYWQVWDYPMLDGAGDRTVMAEVTTGSRGEFTLVRPSARRGLLETKAHPPVVYAVGYCEFAASDWGHSERYDAGEVVIPLRRAQPRRSGQ